MHYILTPNLNAEHFWLNYESTVHWITISSINFYVRNCLKRIDNGYETCSPINRIIFTKRFAQSQSRNIFCHVCSQLFIIFYQIWIFLHKSCLFAQIYTPFLSWKRIVTIACMYVFYQKTVRYWIFIEEIFTDTAWFSSLSFLFKSV